MSKTATELKPLKRDVDTVKAKFPQADADDFQRHQGDDVVTYFMIGEDWEESDAVIGKGDTVREAWANAAQRIKAGQGYLV